MTISYKKIKERYKLGVKFMYNQFILEGQSLSKQELLKEDKRTDIINFLLSKFNHQTEYLEIGVRNPDDNFNKIQATNKYSVDPGVEFKENPVDFKVTSDEFFQGLKEGKYLNPEIKFDAIFIDGLHLAEQVDRDIQNALEFIKEDGFIILHDCNPPTEWHARENFYYYLSPASGYWNGTTWKAFVKYRYRKDIFSCCIDTDWGVGVISRKINFGNIPSVSNEFFEFSKLKENRKEILNLMSFEEFKKLTS